MPVSGRYGFGPVPPDVLGLESVGTVDALGEGVDTLAVGQRVITLGVTGTWRVGKCWFMADFLKVRAEARQTAQSVPRHEPRDLSPAGP